MKIHIFLFLIFFLEERLPKLAKLLNTLANTKKLNFFIFSSLATLAKITFWVGTLVPTPNFSKKFDISKLNSWNACQNHILGRNACQHQTFRRNLIFQSWTLGTLAKTTLWSWNACRKMSKPKFGLGTLAKRWILIQFLKVILIVIHEALTLLFLPGCHVIIRGLGRLAHIWPPWRGPKMWP